METQPVDCIMKVTPKEGNFSKSERTYGPYMEQRAVLYVHSMEDENSNSSKFYDMSFTKLSTSCR